MAITPQAVLAEVMSLLGDKAMINEAAPDKKINSRNDDVAWDRTGS
jgi:hypothetical protein